MDYFDYQSAGREAGLTQEQIQQIAQMVRQEYPTDQMLFELHVLRAIERCMMAGLVWRDCFKQASLASSNDQETNG